MVVLYLGVRKRLERKEGGFNLGRFEVPVSVAALIWVACALVVLVTPDDARLQPDRCGPHRGGGGIYFATMMIFNREVLDAELTGGDAVVAVTEETP